MKNLFARLWNDDAGIVALEYILVATVVGFGLFAGLSALEGGLNDELADLAQAIMSIDQSYSWNTQTDTIHQQVTGVKFGRNWIDQNATASWGASAPPSTTSVYP